MVKIKKINETFLFLECDISIHQEIYEHFKYRPLDYKFDPRYKNHVWNGFISLYNKNSHLIGIGLKEDLCEYLTKNNYEYKLEGDFEKEEFTEEDAKNFIKTLNLPEKFDVRDYQIKYFIEGVKNKKILCEAPTSCGKSLILYLLFRYFNKRSVIIVPNISLVTQMNKDFKSYGFLGDVHLIMEGKTRETDKQLIISTYQSLINEKKIWFDDKEVILFDEVHQAKAKTIKKLVEKCENSTIKIGVSGTLNNRNDNLSMMTIKSLFGPVYKFISTQELIKRGFSSDVEFKIIVLNHKNSPYKENKFGVSYEDEISYILNSPERIEFIKKLCFSLKGNTFVMFNIKSHGMKIYEEIKKSTEIPLFYVDGDYTDKERKEIISSVEKSENSITVSSKVFNTGINIHNLHNIIFVHPTKSRIKTLQTIGRGLRKSSSKKKLVVYDIADKISKNTTSTLLHMKEREKMYEDENFNVQKISVSI